MAQHSVPFCFDGTQLIWLEYVDKATKTLNLYDTTASGTQETIYTFDKNFEFVSHVKKFRKEVIIVKNHKKVQRLDMNTNKIDQFYEHKHQIIALDLWHSWEKDNLGQEKDIKIEIGKKEEEEKTTIVSKSEPSDYSIISIDDREKVSYWKQGKLQTTAAIRE